jgi:hypothetical protein
MDFRFCTWIDAAFNIYDDASFNTTRFARIFIAATSADARALP